MREGQCSTPCSSACVHAPRQRAPQGHRGAAVVVVGNNSSVFPPTFGSGLMSMRLSSSSTISPAYLKSMGHCGTQRQAAGGRRQAAREWTGAGRATRHTSQNALLPSSLTLAPSPAISSFPPAPVQPPALPCPTASTHQRLVHAVRLLPAVVPLLAAVACGATGRQTVWGGDLHKPRRNGLQQSCPCSGMPSRPPSRPHAACLPAIPPARPPTAVVEDQRVPWLQVHHQPAEALSQPKGRGRGKEGVPAEVSSCRCWCSSGGARRQRRRGTARAAPPVCLRRPPPARAATCLVHVCFCGASHGVGAVVRHHQDVLLHERASRQGAGTWMREVVGKAAPAPAQIACSPHV